VQYGDFAVWQRAVLGAEQDGDSELSRQIAYWRATLDALPAEVIPPADRARPAVPSHRGGAVPFAVSAEVCRRLDEEAARADGTLFMVVHAALAALLAGLGAGTDIPVGTVIAGRDDPALDGLVGCFVNTLVLRLDVSGRPTFRELIRRAREADLDAFAHQDVAFEWVVDAVRPERAAGRNPLFQTALLLDAEPAEPPRLAGLACERFPLGPAAVKFDLAFVYRRAVDGGISGRLEYAADLFEEHSAESWARRLEQTLEALAGGPDRPAHAAVPVARP
jgi:non-ribosomal peptide synthetase component F